MSHVRPPDRHTDGGVWVGHGNRANASRNTAYNPTTSATPVRLIRAASRSGVSHQRMRRLTYGTNWLRIRTLAMFPTKSATENGTLSGSVKNGVSINSPKRKTVG